MQSIRNTTAILLLAQVHFCFNAVSNAIAQEADSKVITLGTRFERKPWVRLPWREIVSRFEFSPDGAETWCLAGSGVSRGRAIVFHRKKQAWENIPSRNDPGVFCDVAVSPDGKTTWIAVSSDDDQTQRVRQRGTGTKEWLQLSKPMPDHGVENFWLSPNGHELWMNTVGCGLTRLSLRDHTLLQYVQSEFRQFNGIRQGTLVEDYVHDLVFTSDGKFAICAASGGGDYGITKIELATGKSTNFPVTDAIDFEHLVVSLDNKSVWCIGNNSFLWCFDIESEKWTHKLSSDKDMPISSIDSLVCTRDSNHVWIAGAEGIACYGTGSKKWIGFTTDEWSSDHVIPEFQTVPLLITSDGKYVIAGHATGLALFESDGGQYSTIESDNQKKQSYCSEIVPIPNSTNFLCALEYESGHGGGVFLLDMQTRSLDRLFGVKTPVTALDFSPSNSAWIALPGVVYEIDVSKRSVLRRHTTQTKARGTQSVLEALKGFEQ